MTLTPSARPALQILCTPLGRRLVQQCEKCENVLANGPLSSGRPRLTHRETDDLLSHPVPPVTRFLPAGSRWRSVIL